MRSIHPSPPSVTFLFGLANLTNNDLFRSRNILGNSSLGKDSRAAAKVFPFQAASLVLWALEPAGILVPTAA